MAPSITMSHFVFPLSFGRHKPEGSWEALKERRIQPDSNAKTKSVTCQPFDTAFLFKKEHTEGKTMNGGKARKTNKWELTAEKTNLSVGHKPIVLSSDTCSTITTKKKN